MKMINLQADITTKFITVENFILMQKQIKQIIEKKEWSGRDIGILKINDYIVGGYLLSEQPELKPLYEQYYKFDNKKYQETFKKYSSLVRNRQGERKNLNDFLGYAMSIHNYINKIYSYVRLYSEVVKGRFVYLASQLKNEQSIEQLFFFYHKENKQEEFNQKFANKSVFQYIGNKENEKYKKEVAKVKDYYKEFNTAIYYLYGYNELLKAIKQLYKINIVEVLTLNMQELQEAFKSYNETLSRFKEYIKKQPYAEINVNESMKKQKLELIDEVLKPLNYDFTIPKSKYAELTTIMKKNIENNDYTDFNFNTYEQIICEK